MSKTRISITGPLPPDEAIRRANQIPAKRSPYGELLIIETDDPAVFESIKNSEALSVTWEPDGGIDGVMRVYAKRLLRAVAVSGNIEFYDTGIRFIDPDKSDALDQAAIQAAAHFIAWHTYHEKLSRKRQAAPAMRRRQSEAAQYNAFEFGRLTERLSFLMEYGPLIEGAICLQAGKRDLEKCKKDAKIERRFEALKAEYEKLNHLAPAKQAYKQIANEEGRTAGAVKQQVKRYRTQKRKGVVELSDVPAWLMNYIGT